MEIEIDMSKRPEGATHYNASPSNNGRIHSWMKKSDSYWYFHADGLWWLQTGKLPELGDSLIQLPHECHVGFSEQIQEGIDDADAGRLKPLSEVKAKYAWDGEGLPPEGPLEYKSNDGWRLGECVAIRDGYAVIWVNCGNLFAVSEHDKGALRPIRTPEQIAAQEKDEAIEEIAKATGLRARDGRMAVAIAIYAAGYRKQVEE